MCADTCFFTLSRLNNPKMGRGCTLGLKQSGIWLCLGRHEISTYKLCSMCGLSWIFADLYHLTTYVADSRVSMYKEVAVFFANLPSLHNSWFSRLWIFRCKPLKWASYWLAGWLDGCSSWRDCSPQKLGWRTGVMCVLSSLKFSFTVDCWADQGNIWQILLTWTKF